MFEYYQVTGMHMEFIPNRYQGDIASTGAVLTTVYPIVSCITPEDVALSIDPEVFYSFGNGKITAPYVSHSRSIKNYTNLSILK